MMYSFTTSKIVLLDGSTTIASCQPHCFLFYPETDPCSLFDTPANPWPPGADPSSWTVIPATVAAPKSNRPMILP
jgi:hypothetical protein